MDSGIIEHFFSSGHAADVMLVVLVLEGIWLSRRGWSFRKITGLLGPAFLIVIGLRAALVGADWYWIAAPLAASLPLHLMDLQTRFKD
ncbi:MAG: hypothetical protein WBA51_10625 [Erythrobacter sp.]